MNIVKKNLVEVYKLILAVNFFEKNDNLIWDIRYDIRDLEEYFSFKGKSVLDKWPSDATVMVSGHIPVDYFYAGPNKIVSDKAKNLIQQKYPENAEFLPIQVIRQDNGEHLGPYWVLNMLHYLEALDEENTLWSRPAGIPLGDIPPRNMPGSDISFIRPALKRGMVVDTGIFGVTIRGHIRAGSVFITHDLKKELTKAKATLGMAFAPVKTV